MNSKNLFNETRQLDIFKENLYILINKNILEYLQLYIIVILMVIWLTGISGSGKTTISNGLLKKYKNSMPNLINIDGDTVREFFGQKLKYDEISRIKQIKRIQKICKFLEKQELVLIVSALYSNPDLMFWNRENFSKYYEIYLEASVKLVQKRDPKKIYLKFKEGKEKQVVGLDIPWYPPKNYDLKINMDNNYSEDQVIKKISSEIDIFKNVSNTK